MSTKRRGLRCLCDCDISICVNFMFYQSQYLLYYLKLGNEAKKFIHCHFMMLCSDDCKAHVMSSIEISFQTCYGVCWPVLQLRRVQTHSTCWEDFLSLLLKLHMWTVISHGVSIRISMWLRSGSWVHRQLKRYIIHWTTKRSLFVQIVLNMLYGHSIQSYSVL